MIVSVTRTLGRPAPEAGVVDGGSRSGDRAVDLMAISGA